MRAAATFGALVVSGLLGVASGVTAAGENVDQIGTVTSLVSSVVGQTTVVSGVVSTATEPVDQAFSSGAGSEQAQSARATRIRTMFDRLPRRIEILLERIEMGQKLRTSSRRLERALAAASPRLRARVLRLVRSELRRLERGGITGVERGRVKRLRRVANALAQPGGLARNGSDTSTLRDRPGVSPTAAPSGQGAPASTSQSGSRPFTGSAARSSPPSKAGEQEEDGGGGLNLPPDWEPQIPFGLFVLLLVLLPLALLALFLAALVPERSPRGRLQGFLRQSRIALAVTVGITLSAIVLVLFL
jgi:hypothetical protein